MSIKIYSTPSCPYCLQAKNYFESKDIEYKEIDVSRDPKAAEKMMKISNQMGVPVITVNDQVVVGFDKERIEELLISTE